MYAGVDLGATNIRTVVADETGTITGSDERPTPPGPTGIAVTDAILGSLKAACDAAAIAPTNIWAVGVGSIGPLDLAEGVIEDPANLPDTIDHIPLTSPIESLTETDRVYLHNDTSAGVIGERFHAAQNPDDMVYLTISSGIGAGVCVDGHILSGWDGNAGEVGHSTLDPAGEMHCGCGMDGHWEAYCSGNNIPLYAKHLFEEMSMNTALPIDDPDLDAATVFAEVGDDAFATHVIEQVAAWNAMGIANLVQSYAPLVVYVGGAVPLNNPEVTLDPVRDRIADMVMVNVPEIKLTTLGDDVVVRGALASAMSEGTGDRSKLRAGVKIE
ncbi:ROK family protein [Haladaptatus sp. GCM10025707]|uniref:ROK family protein n=1 Tax=unclassified Haladaptatus TaxID=2622732 RepID=UPI0023E89B2E|nr:ROK family protein [Haladaptatus sp. QDMS2]